MSYHITGLIYRVKESKSYPVFHVTDYDLKMKKHRKLYKISEIDLNKNDILLKEHNGFYTLHRSDRMVFNIEIQDQDLTSKNEKREIKC